MILSWNYIYSLCPNHFLWFLFWDVPSNSLHFKTYQKWSMGPTTFPLSQFSSFFTLLLLHSRLLYTLKVNEFHHFTYFSLSLPLLYTYILTTVHKPNVKNWLGRREYVLWLKYTFTIEVSPDTHASHQSITKYSLSTELLWLLWWLVCISGETLITSMVKPYLLLL